MIRSDPTAQHASSSLDLVNNKKRKADVLLLRGVTMSAKAEVNGVLVDAIIDTGATITCVSKIFVPDSAVRK